MDENRMVKSILKSSFSLEEVMDFQHKFKNRTVGRTTFLNTVKPKPTYADQIQTAVLHTMANPKNGIEPCGFNERAGDRNYRLKQLEEAEQAKKDPNHKVKKASKIVEANEEGLLKQAVNKCLVPFKYVQDHRDTLFHRCRALFDTPILKAIADADPEGTKTKEKRVIGRMSCPSIVDAMKSVSKAMETLPALSIRRR